MTSTTRPRLQACSRNASSAFQGPILAARRWIRGSELSLRGHPLRRAAGQARHAEDPEHPGRCECIGKEPEGRRLSSSSATPRKLENFQAEVVCKLSAWTRNLVFPIPGGPSIRLMLLRTCWEHFSSREVSRASSAGRPTKKLSGHADTAAS